MRKIFGKFFMFVGVFFLIAAGVLTFQRYNPNRLKFIDYKPATQNVPQRAGAPKHLVINELGINLDVFPAEIVNDRWQTTYDGISYLSTSPIPGNLGNSILYGHNWNSLLGNLKNAKPGQIIEIIDNAGNVTRFEVNFVQVVGPDEKSILNQTTDSRLTLYTCTGFLDSKRLVVTALKV